MKEFTASVVTLLKDLSGLEKIAVQTVSDSCSQLAQTTQAEAANQLYAVIEKKAQESSESVVLSHEKIVHLIEKMAEEVGKSPLSNDYKAKIAAAVILDTTFQQEYPKADSDNKLKIAMLSNYGREYIMDLLRGALT